jgi:hypothetical protein
MISHVFELFSVDPDAAAFAAASLKILSDAAGDRLLSKDNFANVKVIPVGIASSTDLNAETAGLPILADALSTTAIQYTAAVDDGGQQNSTRGSPDTLSARTRVNHHHCASRADHLSFERDLAADHARPGAAKSGNSMQHAACPYIDTGSRGRRRNLEPPALASKVSCRGVTRSRYGSRPGEQFGCELCLSRMPSGAQESLLNTFSMLTIAEKQNGRAKVLGYTSRYGPV